MRRHHPGSDRPALITTAPESAEQEFDRRTKRYAIMAAIFIASFTAGALLHRHTILALLLCGVAIVTLVAAVIMGNAHSRPRKANRFGHMMHRERQLPPSPTDRTVS
ncbi:MAG TPA: DUF3099 domain-containing protein [Jatrophihabitantaceae bacterium]|jgi:hypothetical protein